MTATRIRETPDGVLYRLSDPVAFTTWGVTHFRASTDHVLIGPGAANGWTSVYASAPSGRWDESDVVVTEPGTIDPDAMIEEMGYTVINGEEL